MLYSNQVDLAIIKASNTALTEDQANELVEEACLLASIDIRSAARQARETEFNIKAIDKHRAECQEIERQNSAEALHRANLGADRRQAQLKAAEDAQGPMRRRGIANNDLF